MKILKYTIWPIIVGILGLLVFFVVMNVSYDLLAALASVPVINMLFLLNVSILGIDVISIESLAIGSVAAMMFMALCTKYDHYEEHHCYAKASRTCGIFYALYLALTIYIFFTSYEITFSVVSSIAPYLIFGILLLNGSKFE